ncbi:hypothetical protein VSH64_40580 [Amycolatopsis rhabdoformis]|uniref:Uncharacterized protein n=1 Tax=Amycolatopsis rhabdoformis TaxID=1448059 RepID=A0ABZ1I3T6_9PSEU|nr:hypothetical protein [Amycolatopsis rhabdoformis]WSE29052.1 hypothetical protein VSH64_40580 [Amycolatopsis rhabdoformis]
MTDYLKFEAAHATAAGITGINNELAVGDLRVSLPRPFVPIGGDLAVGPVIEAVSNGLLIRTDRWTAMNLDPYATGVLPLTIASQATAAAVAREFDADPTITWTSRAADVLAWCQRWVTRQNGGGQS